MIGVLVMQDLYFGLLITLLPMMGSNASSFDAIWQVRAVRMVWLLEQRFRSYHSQGQHPR
jgi:hypothetical protein